MRSFRPLVLGLLLLSLAGVSWGEEGEFLYEQYLTEDPVATVQGCVEGGCRHGKGRYVYPLGDVYEGDFKFGQRHGKGNYTYAKGGVYEGEWEWGFGHGRGRLTDDDGKVYEGVFENGKYMGTEAEIERKETQRIALLEKERAAQAKYKRIFNACLLDKSADLDLQVKSIEDAVKATCGAVAKDPSWLESLQYD